MAEQNDTVAGGRAASKKIEPKGRQPKASKLRLISSLYWAKRAVTIPLTVLIIALVLAAIPFSRYAMIGLIVKPNIQVTVIDSRTNTPVSKALVTIGGQKVVTDATGSARVYANVGYHTLSITKQYYQSDSQAWLVDLPAQHITLKLIALGRLVPIAITNKLTGKPVAGATIGALHAEATTAQDGTATLVLPAETVRGR